VIICQEEMELAPEAKAQVWEEVWGWVGAVGAMPVREAIAYALRAAKRCLIRQAHPAH